MEHLTSYFYTHTSGASKDDLPFTLESIGCNCVEADVHTYPISEKACFFLLCTEGQCIIETDKQHFTLEENTAICLYAEEDDRIEIHSFPTCTYRHAVFHASAAQYFIKMLNLPCRIQLSKQDASIFSNYFDELYENVVFELGNKDITLNLVITEMMTFFVKKHQERILQSFQHPVTENYHYRRPTLPGKANVSNKNKNEINKVLLYIHNQYNKQITLDELSRMIHFNKCYFVKIFRSLVGMSPYEYIINLRINEAKQLLINTSFSVNKIADQIGFLDTNNFIRRFRSRTGVSPLQYRKQFKP
ncbi:MAG: helix-turn-helix transcriptional regulator [Clostridia bacterium]|nr:helix-turn-helix transcriptional regulator [Clostridia bacterium]